MSNEANGNDENNPLVELQMEEDKNNIFKLAKN